MTIKTGYRVLSASVPDDVANRIEKYRLGGQGKTRYIVRSRSEAIRFVIEMGLIACDKLSEIP
jgi:hypothetical protein